jgi:ubiquinone/menaquinone biosynthesis C-methylase UbiE
VFRKHKYYICQSWQDVINSVPVNVLSINLMNNSTTDQQVSGHFDSVAGGYANAYKDGSFFSYFFNRRLEIILDSLNKYDHAKILDVGCGPGMMAEYAIEKKFEFFGIDISEKMIEECINNFGHANCTHFSVGKLQKLEFSDSSFDVVLCMGALEYVERDEIEDALAEMIRVLKPDGQIIMSLMNKNSFFAWHRRLKGKILKRIKGRDFQAESYDEFSKPFEENSIRALLNSKQLNNIETVHFGLNIYPYFLEWRIPNRLRIKVSKILDGVIRGFFKWPYMAFIVKARK